MKTVFLVRHSEPMRLPDVPNHELPLSARGQLLAKELFGRNVFSKVKRVYSSPYVRALETASCTNKPVIVDERLKERETGQATPEMGDCWLRQYEDHGFKCPGGESFNEVQMRMTACMNDILGDIADGEASIVVTHAAAICAYLLDQCTIRVVDRAAKKREVLWNEHSVYTGSIPTPSGFCLGFNGEKLVDIASIEA